MLGARAVALEGARASSFIRAPARYGVRRAVGAARVANPGLACLGPDSTSASPPSALQVNIQRNGFTYLPERLMQTTPNVTNFIGEYMVELPTLP